MVCIVEHRAKFIVATVKMVEEGEETLSLCSQY